MDKATKTTTIPKPCLISVYKSKKKDEMYLFVAKQQGFSQLPDSLLKVYGQPEPVFDLLLTPAKKLARADAVEVLNEINEQGFYLQMPPADNEVADLVKLKEQMPAKGRISD